MSTKRHQVVIVGAGVSGAASALRVRDLLGDAVDILVLEAGEKVGGRACRTSFAGELVEVGGTLLHSTNRQVVEVMERLGLERAAPAEGAPIVSSAIGIWDGRRLVLDAPANGWRFLASVVGRYRLRSLRRLRATASDALERFRSLYAQLDAGRVFTTPAELAEAVGIADISRSTLGDSLRARGVSQRVVDEIATGVVHNMYNQEPDMAAFPGLAGLIGAGLAGGSLFSVEGGNDAIVQGSLRLAAATVRTGARVTEVRADREVLLADGTSIPADIVVLAVPLAVAGITVPQGVAVPPTRYRHMHVTLVAGHPSPAYFGTTNTLGVVFTTAAKERAFNSLGQTGWSRQYGVPILKFFSLERMPDDLVHAIVDDVREVARLEWDAYPIMEVDPVSASFELAPGVFFPNALEPIISTLETESLAGRVVGDLVAARLRAASSGVSPEIGPGISPGTSPETSPEISPEASTGAGA